MRYRLKETLEISQWFEDKPHPAVFPIPEKYKKFIPVQEGAKRLS